MNSAARFPRYIARPEEEEIRRRAEQVRTSRQSQAVLLYGAGGVGKTLLLRELARTGGAHPGMIWLDPIDVDDSEYWLLSNLERRVIDQVDPDHVHFGSYRALLENLDLEDYATTVTRLSRVKREFFQSYREYINRTGRTVVIAFDTMEAIRGMDPVITLTQWMKAVPATLFVLSGRPPAEGTPDPIEAELSDPHQPVPLSSVHLGGFTEDAARQYLTSGMVATSLSAEEVSKLVHLSRGHPLWLALTHDYLVEKGIPDEAGQELDHISGNVPFAGEMTPVGAALHEEFKRRLVTPYLDADFWHETTKRLAVVRKSVNQRLWRMLMDDRPLPEDVPGWDEAWQRLLQTPWIRPRANRRYVTLHDALADELAQRLIPVEDLNQQWRRDLWRRAGVIFGEVSGEAATDFERERRSWLEMVRAGRPDGTGDAVLVDMASRLRADEQELNQLRTAALYYLLLTDPSAGCQEFVRLFDSGGKGREFLFRSLIVMELQRLLAEPPQPVAGADVVRDIEQGLRTWLSGDGADCYVRLGLRMAEFLIPHAQPERALELLQRLPVSKADAVQRFHWRLLLANAYLRMRGRIREAEEQFRQALFDAEALTLASPSRSKLVAEGHKELGFYYRNVGLWEQADESYHDAYTTLAKTLSSRSTPEDREEMASIQTNWAYVKALRGSYAEGRNLVESAIAVRRKLGNELGVGISWSVYGELLRYNTNFVEAWACYTRAQQIFESLRSWPWLGLLYQEQAMCLFQAAQNNVALGAHQDSAAEAELRITLALDICRDQFVRGYPSALNRAARIVGKSDVDRALGYLEEGIQEARDLSDAWFWLANSIEYVEMCYRAWLDTGSSAYRDKITAREPDIHEAMSEYQFSDLRGRWHLLQGHLGIRDALASGKFDRLPTVLQHYDEGFQQLAKGYVGSHGQGAVPREFANFADHFRRLPPNYRDEWLDALGRSWEDNIILLSRLADLY